MPSVVCGGGDGGGSCAHRGHLKADGQLSRPVRARGFARPCSEPEPHCGFPKRTPTPRPETLKHELVRPDVLKFAKP